MKHLKLYNESIKIEKEILQDLKEICLDLTDDDKFKIEFSEGETYSSFAVIINRDIKENYIPRQGMPDQIQRAYPEFSYDEISETIERLKDYMKSNGYSTDVRFYNMDGRVNQQHDCFLYIALIFDK